jgi:hypothetical protein
MSVLVGIAVLAFFFAVRIASGRMVLFVELFAEPIGITGRKLHSSEQRETNHARVADVAPKVEKTRQRQVADPRLGAADYAVVLDGGTDER